MPAMMIDYVLSLWKVEVDEIYWSTSLLFILHCLKADFTWNHAPSSNQDVSTQHPRSMTLVLMTALS